MNEASKHAWIRRSISTLFNLGVLVFTLFALTGQQGILLSPEAVVRDYLNSIYAGDYSRAYWLISSIDRVHKSQEKYLNEKRSLTGQTLELSRQLASYIQYQEILIEKQGNGAVATVEMLVPDGNIPQVREILFSSSANVDSRTEQLRQLYSHGQIPMLAAEQTVQLMRERGNWRVFESWADAIPIHFSGEVRDGLSWEFEPMQEVVLAKPGETLWNMYRAKNLSEQPLTGKARHLNRPEASAEFLEIVQCFCLVQQQLKPGEETKMPLIMQLAVDLPSETKALYVHYEFYPIESFPED